MCLGDVIAATAKRSELGSSNCFWRSYWRALVNVEIVKRSDKANGFLAQPKRWIVERTPRLARPLP